MAQVKFVVEVELDVVGGNAPADVAFAAKIAIAEALEAVVTNLGAAVDQDTSFFRVNAEKE